MATINHASRFSRKIIKNIYSKFNKNNIVQSSCHIGFRNTEINCRQLHSTIQLNKKISFNLSDIGEGIREVTVKEWFVKVGDKVEQFDNLCEVQSDKASVTITSRYDGVIIKLHANIDDIALVGSPLLDFEVDDENQDSESISSDSSSSSSSEEDAENAEDEDQQSKIKSNKAIATPAVRRIAMENKVDLTKVPATGPQGRILKGDILEYLNLLPASTKNPDVSSKIINKVSSAPSAQVTPPKVTKPLATDRIEQLKGVRKIMFKNMTESLKIPHFAYSDEIDMTNLVSIREFLKSEAQNRGVKLTFMPFMIKAASSALKKFPILNSSLNVNDETITYKASHNVSIAMATHEGLVVPNVKNCGQKTIFEIAVILNDLQSRALKGQLKPDDFANGTFSLSNIGIIGGTYTHPCIMSPQVAIGALGKTKILPRFGENGEIVPKHIMNVSWSADHRIIDGVTMASFSELWKHYLENPKLFLLDEH